MIQDDDDPIIMTIAVTISLLLSTYYGLYRLIINMIEKYD